VRSVNIFLFAASLLATIAVGGAIVWRVLGGFEHFSLADRLALGNIVATYAAASFTLNGLFGDTAERPSKIGAALCAIGAGVLAALAKVAALEPPAQPGMLPQRPESLRGVVRELLRRS